MTGLGEKITIAHTLHRNQPTTIRMTLYRNLSQFMMIDDPCAGGRGTSKSVNGSEETEKKGQSPDCHCASITAAIYQWYKRAVRRRLNRSHVGGSILRSLTVKQCILEAWIHGEGWWMWKREDAIAGPDEWINKCGSKVNEDWSVKNMGHPASSLRPLGLLKDFEVLWRWMSWWGQQTDQSRAERWCFV